MNSPERHRLRLLGPFALVCNAQPSELAYEKGRALLAYLALEPGRSHPRAALAALFWPDMPRTTGLANLRLVLHNLRQKLTTADPNHAALQITRDAVMLRADADLDIDAARFAAPTPACTALPLPAWCDTCLADMEAVAALYRGEFLEGFSLPDCPEFDDWLQAQRETLLQRALGRLTVLSDHHARTGAHPRALPFAQRFLALDPWNEHGLRRVMRLLALSGQRDTALAQHDKWCRVVADELGLSPSDETRALAHSIRSNDPSLATRRATDGQPQASVAAAVPAPQRRQVTVLHCALDVVAEEDQEDALHLLAGPQSRVSEIVRAYSGYLVQVHGGSLLAYFGYPHASENAARQAVLAALTLSRATFVGVEARVGIHTGMVISGGAPNVPDAIGATSGLAIRLRQEVGPGAVAISAATQRLVAGYFDCTSLGPRAVAGARHPVEVFLVEQESGAQDRLQAAASLTPLVGRTQELATLLAIWGEAHHGVPRSVLLRGEAGIGKSRVVLSLREALQAQPMGLTELRCLPEYSQSPFHPLVALFHAILAFSPADTPQARFERLAAYVGRNYPADDPDVLPLLAKLLSLPLPAPYTEPAASPAEQREKTLQIVFDRLYALAQPHALLLVVEDLHWADPSSLELLNRIVTQKRAGIVMALFTARAGFKPPWPDSACTTLDLAALNVAQAGALVDTLMPGLAPAAVRSIVERADGIPLFVEELAKEMAAIAAKDALSPDRWTIPSTLQDLLAARLDGTGTAKPVAQWAATIGREFGVDLLHTISGLDEVALTHALRQLRDVGLVRATSATAYQFGHALIRDAAYQSQTRSEREVTHKRIATALQAGGSENRPELLAQHWAAAGANREAATCWAAAGQLASQHCANQEAILHFKAGLALLETLPLDAQRIRTELALQIGLGTAYCATQGYTCAAGAKAFSRAVALCTEHEGALDMFVAIWGLWASASLRVDYDHSLELAQQLQRMAEQGGDPIQHQQAQFALGVTHFRRGDIVVAYSHFQYVDAQYLPAHHAGHVAAFGEDAGVTNGSYRSAVLWFLGLTEQAATVSAQTLAYARQLGHPFSLAYALTFAMFLHCHLRQPHAALALADETKILVDKHGFALWRMGAMLCRGWAQAQLGQPEGVVLMKHCVDATHLAMGTVEAVAMVPLADAYVARGQFDAALGVIEQAVATAAAKGDHHQDAELYRLKGEALWGQSPDHAATAKALFGQALAISQQQNAQSLALRAAMSLARLCHAQGALDEARAVLDATCTGLTEGWGTPDGVAARQLRERLTAL
jgi:DNA-binding SARP family transcriptional activator/tetratricopeptide (TPR) repeat protein